MLYVCHRSINGENKMQDTVQHLLNTLNESHIKLRYRYIIKRINGVK